MYTDAHFDVFVDTQVFIAVAFNYEHFTFDRLRRLCGNGVVRLIMTDITRREILSHIEQETRTAFQALETFRKKARVLRNLDTSLVPALDDSFTAEDACKLLADQFERFLKEVQAEELSTREMKCGNAMDRYFERRPPFGDGKKKSEFPDAFVLEALDRRCNELAYAEKSPAVPVYVVSGDSDMRDGCADRPNLKYTDGLEKFLGLVTFRIERLAPSVADAVAARPETIIAKIQEQFASLGVSLDDLQWDEFDVEDVAVTNVELIDVNLIEVSADSAVLEVEAEISFEANVSYCDMRDAAWDNDDKKYIFLGDRVEERLNRKVTLPMELNLTFPSEQPESFEVKSARIDSRRSIIIGLNGEGARAV